MRVHSEKIEVKTEGEPLRPASFIWRDQEFKIAKIRRSWQDWKFPAGAPRRKTWRLRRHRTYFVVETPDGRTFEIYMDRKPPEPVWVLYREL